MLYIVITRTYYKGVNGEYLFVDKDYSIFPTKEEAEASFHHYSSSMKEDGYNVTVSGNEITCTLLDEKLVSKYYECNSIIF